MMWFYCFAWGTLHVEGNPAMNCGKHGDETLGGKVSKPRHRRACDDLEHSGSNWPNYNDCNCATEVF